jgi:L-threonylcarbamoyladenylate synthase
MPEMSEHPFREDIEKALATLRVGGVVLYPTDTIWGLGCDPTNAEAVQKIFRIKEREPGKSLLVLVNGEVMLERYVADLPEIALELLGVSEEPLTIVYPSGKNLASGVCSEDGSVGIRICRDEFCSELIGRFRKPLVSTSANLSGMPAPENFSDIDAKVISSADYVVNYRQDDRRQFRSSPVIRLNSDGTIQIIRK